jgi:beta-phosphoglucomutase-like phosphatase (HAD superfamily)
VEPSCLVLDFDGTILDTEESLFLAWAELWEDHGQRLERTDWQENIGSEDVFDPWAELERRLGRPLDAGLEERRRARRDEIQASRGPRAGVLDWLSQAERSGIAVVPGLSGRARAGEALPDVVSGGL